MKIIFVTGSRGEWGYIRPILRLIEKKKDIEYVIVVTNMHLLNSYGNSYKEIEKDGFKINYKINMSLDGYNHITHAKSLGIFMQSLPDIIETEKPDWILLAGDRGEQLMAAIAGAYTYTPVAHIQAGELSGNIDGMTRHAIGKLIHIHFASNSDAEKRLIALGEESHRVHNVGAPQIDEMVELDYTNIKKIESKYNLDLKNGYILGVLHPVTEEYKQTQEKTKKYIDALNEVDLTKILILPNNDAGSKIVLETLETNKKGKYHLFSNLNREEYLTLLKNCKCIVGNSSSGLLEAPTFKVPSVNIGRRQKDRFRGNNVIDVDFDTNDIIDGIKKAISYSFKEYLEVNCENPYGVGNSSQKILDILLETPIDSKLLIKSLTF